ncbi:hypothetical protein PBY51_003623 [Eleginops maclovinus]|uniref:Myb/SANT-like DNA-binding domain-containing protein n=1 Tax=Eleginops maclovinus TaxID=56733 RepID=A0AAN8AWN3_ELEMC|nr:hypothetical protein PBY51_003623 [Eleginops maclovinus]
MNYPMINSTSFVSTTRRKREAERSVNWTVEETQVLLCAWSDERIQKSLAENLRNRHVFKHLSVRMSEMGFSRSPHQCRLRVKTLKANYVRAKLQRSSSQPCTFKYFAEMDAVLGRRSEAEEGGPYFVSTGRMAGRHLDSFDSTGTIPTDLNSHTENHLGCSGSTGRQRLNSLEERAGRQSWQLDSEVKLEDRDVSTDEFDSSNTGFPQRHHEVYTESSIHCEITGSLVENSSPSTHIVPPQPPAASPPPPPAAVTQSSPLPRLSDPSPNTVPTSGHLPSESSCPKHLSECFKWLVSETRGLMVQLESQRQEQARCHQELLSQWLQREERWQRETAEREERREKARMEHEIRVLELLTSLAREGKCKCGGNKTVGEATNHTCNKGEK